MEMIEEQLHLLQNVKILLNKGENKKSKENGEPRGEEATDGDPGEADNRLEPETGEGDIKVRKLHIIIFVLNITINTTTSPTYCSIKTAWRKILATVYSS